MRWFDTKSKELSRALIPYRLHGINEDIYDEIVKRSDGYYLIKRCGMMPYTALHNFSAVKTDGINMIYPLPPDQIEEIKLDFKPPTLLGDNATIVMNSGLSVPEFSGKVAIDRKYKEFRESVGSNEEIKDYSTINHDNPIYIDEVYGTIDGLGELIVDDAGAALLDADGKEQYLITITNASGDNESVATLVSPKKLYSNERLVWNSTRGKYEVLPIFNIHSPIEGMKYWFDARDGKGEDFTWIDRITNKQIDLSNYTREISWDVNSYLISPTNNKVVVKAFTETLNNGYAFEYSFSTDLGTDTLELLGGTYKLVNEFNQEVGIGYGKLYLYQGDKKTLLLDEKENPNRRNETYKLTINADNQGVDIYFDGQQIENEFVFNSVLDVDLIRDGNVYVKWNSLKLYDRKLTSEEILHNFNYENPIDRKGFKIPISKENPITDGLIANFDGRDGLQSGEWRNRVDKENGIIKTNNIMLDGGVRLNGGVSIKNVTKGLDTYTVDMYFRKEDNSYWYGLWGNANYATGSNVRGASSTDLRIKTSTSEYTMKLNTPLVNTNWTRLTFVINKGVATIYENGEVLGSGISAIAPSTAENMLLNAVKDSVSTDSGYGVDGRLHTYRSIRIYSKALNAEEINYNIEYDQIAFVRSKASTVSLQRYKSVRTRAAIELFEESNNFSDIKFTLNIPRKEKRHLPYPKNVVATISTDSDLVTLKWDSVVGADGYKIFVKGQERDVVDTNYWETREEIDGMVTVVAINEISQSRPSEEVYIKSVPNETFIMYLQNEYKNGYQFEIYFPDSSNMEDGYRLYYKVDDRAEQKIEIPKSETQGTIIKHKFSVPVLLDRIQVRVTSYNDVGENTVVPPTTLYITPTPIWTYKDDAKMLLISWTNKYEGVSGYNIRNSINGVAQDDILIETKDIIVGAKVNYEIPLKDTEQIKISVAAVMGDVHHIYSEEITCSKALDKSLIPPSDFNYRRIDGGKQIEFTWYDEHTNEEGFEFTYSVSNMPPTTVFIPSTSITSTGRRYSYTHTFEEHGFINAKVRMKWELGNSEYTDQKTVYYLPSSDLPPSYIRRDGINGKYTVEWEPQSYVSKYVLHKKIGARPEEVIELSGNTYQLDLNYEEIANDNSTNAFESDNKWIVNKYTKAKYFANKKDKGWIEGLEPLATVYMNATSGSVAPGGWGDNFIAHAETYAYVEDDVTLEMTLVTDDEGFFMVNNVKIAETATNVRQVVDVNLKKGWNRLELIVHQSTGGFSMGFAKALTGYYQIRKIASAYEKVPTGVEISILTKFLNENESEKSKPMIFYPQLQTTTMNSVMTTQDKAQEIVNTSVYSIVDNSAIVEVKTCGHQEFDALLHAQTVSKFMRTETDLHSTIFFKDLTLTNTVEGKISYPSATQGDYAIQTISRDRISKEALFESTIFTRNLVEQYIHTEINKVRIVTIGDSITSGHPGWWAETGTGDEKSQYQYWLNIRLKGQFEIINKGYGSDTTDDILARFDKDVLGYNAKYCLIQGGTNDLYWAMAEANGDVNYLNQKLSVMKNNLIQMSRKCWDNDIIPIIGTLIPRTGATGIYKDALYEYNQWIIDYCLGNENIYYVDFFNAGKEKMPPTPLEDPTNPGAMNPIYDGDALYDEYGNLIKQGRGIHPNWEGYRIMGEAIPLTIFKTGDTGLKLYLDKNCTIEETYNDEDKVNPFYEVDISGIRRARTKKLIRYVKNVGTGQNMFVAYSYDNYNARVNFIDEKTGERKTYANGLLNAEGVAKIEMLFNVDDKDSTARVNLYLASRELKIH